MNRGFARHVVLTAALSAACLMGCSAPVPCNPSEEECDGGFTNLPDVCNNRNEALSDPQCKLTLGMEHQAFISYGVDGGDQDWYSVDIPATVNGRSLLHVSGGYGVPSTAVNMAINVLKEDGTMSLARESDRHGQAAPKPVDIILPYGLPSTKLLIQVADDPVTQYPNFDVKNPYLIKVEVMENPDPNEPNDMTPTPITMTAMGAEQRGTVAGAALATDNDIDKYTFTAPGPSGGRNKIIYLHITGPNPQKTPAPQYKMSYVLADPANKPVAEGIMDNEYLPIDLATARLATAGQYTLTVQGYRTPNNPNAVIPGDVDLKYDIEIRIMDDLDMLEPNDTPGQKVVNLSLGAPQQLVGKLAYVPDPDWFAVTLGTNSNPTVLTYRLRVAGGGGRFTALPGNLDRQVRITTTVTQGATLQDKQLACRTDDAVCPKAYYGSDNAKALVEGLCNTMTPQCLWSERDENFNHPNLNNFAGSVYIPPHSGNYVLNVAVQDDGNDYADDRDWTLDLLWASDADETMRMGLPNKTAVSSLSAGSVPVPPTSGEVSGELTYGYGRMLNFDINRGEGFRGIDDYDAVLDEDRFQFNVGGSGDQTWTIQWEIAHQADGGGIPGDIALDLEFCTAAGTCNIKRALAYQSGRIQPWYGQSLTDRTVIWDKQDVGNATIITAQPAGCFCFDPRVSSIGSYFASVSAVDRVSMAPIRYKVRQGTASYPQSFTADGGSVSCPGGTGADGGSCGLTN